MISIGTLADEVLEVVRNETTEAEKTASDAQTVAAIPAQPNDVTAALRKIAAELRSNPNPEEITVEDLRQFIRSGT